jgi:hypothetical protein
MSRVLMACLLALLGVFAVGGVATASTAGGTGYSVAQPTATNGPDLNPQQEVSPEQKAETKKKLWIGAIAVIMFVLVYYRNKKRWSRWRKRVAAKKAAEG